MSNHAHFLLRSGPGGVAQLMRRLLTVFRKTPAAARRSYAKYIKAGYGQGRRPELTGGGLIRNLGGWAAAKKLRLKGQDRLKVDERILGDSDFVTAIVDRDFESYF